MTSKLERFRAAWQESGATGVVSGVQHGFAWRFRKVRFAGRRGRARAKNRFARARYLTMLKVRQSARRVYRRSPQLRRAVRSVAQGTMTSSPPVTMASADSLSYAAERLDLIQVSERPLIEHTAPAELSVAIIIPTFRDSSFLAETLASVQAQTYENWRCYIIDDASPECVDDIFAEFESDERFVLARHGRNAGLAAARNTGIRMVDEDLIQFLDADDLLTPWALHARVSTLQPLWNDPMIAGVHGQIIQCTEETTLDDVRGWKQRPGVPMRDFVATDGESPFTVHAPLTRSQIVRDLGGFDESYVNGAEDWEFWHRVLRHGYRFDSVNMVIGAYRQRKTSMIREFSDIHLDRADWLFAAADRPAIVLPDVAVGHATMPLGQARNALRRAVRTARWAGIETARCGRVDEALTPRHFEFLDPSGMVETRRPDIVAAARGGLVRGLGLSVHVLYGLSEDHRQKIDLVAGDIADALLAHIAEARTPADPSDAVDLTGRRSVDVGVIAATAADVAVLAEAADRFEASGLSVVAIDVDPVDGDQGAAAAWAHAGRAVTSFNAVALGQCRPRLALTRRPASPGTIDLLEAASSWGGVGRILREADRGLEVEESPSARVEITEVDVDEALELLSDAEPLDRDVSTDWRGSNYALLLPREETPLDADGYERLLELRNSRAGETAVIIGNGPSLNDTDLDLLAGVPTFGVNSIFLADERLPEPLTYYVVEDTAVFKDNMPAVKAYEAGLKLFPSLYRSSFADDEITDNMIFFRMNMGFYGRSTGTECLPRFSLDAGQRVFCGQSVTIINLQLAHWFGFDRVVLIGMDFSYTIPDDAERSGNIIVSRSDDPNHFHPDYFGAGKTWKDPKLDRVLINYRLAREIYQASGREIVNATVGGKLEEFPRMTLADAVRR